jgi:hypothetical protein
MIRDKEMPSNVSNYYKHSVLFIEDVILPLVSMISYYVLPVSLINFTLQSLLNPEFIHKRSYPDNRVSCNIYRTYYPLIFTPNALKTKPSQDHQPSRSR